MYYRSVTVDVTMLLKDLLAERDGVDRRQLTVAIIIIIIIVIVIVIMCLGCICIIMCLLSSSQ